MSLNRLCILFLKVQQSIDDYLIRIKEFVDKLAIVSVVINDEDIHLYTLNALSPKFNSVKTSIRTRSEYVTLDKLHALLKSESKFIEQLKKSLSSSINPTTMFARGSNPN